MLIRKLCFTAKPVRNDAPQTASPTSLRGVTQDQAAADAQPPLSPLMLAVATGDVSGVAEAVACSDINERYGLYGMTPLMAAVNFRNADMVVALLQHGADRNLLTALGTSAVDLAAGQAHISPKVAALLVPVATQPTDLTEDVTPAPARNPTTASQAMRNALRRLAGRFIALP